MLGVNDGSFAGSRAVDLVGRELGQQRLAERRRMRGQRATDPGDQVCRLLGLARLQVDDVVVLPACVVGREAGLRPDLLQRSGRVGDGGVTVEVRGAAEQRAYAEAEAGLAGSVSSQPAPAGCAAGRAGSIAGVR